MILRIVHFNDPVLRQKGSPITVFNDALLDLADNMVDTMDAACGIGLAAQQVGRALQLCVIDLTPTDRDFTWDYDGAKPPLDLIMPMALVNPVVEVLPSEKTLYEEGCLSFPDIRGDVERPDAIKATFQDLSGVKHTLVCDGLLARCIQHEVDHLNGTLFIDRMSKSVRAGVTREVKALAERTREAAGAE